MQRIRYFEDTGGREIKSTRIRPLMICNFECDYQVDIPTDFHQCAVDDLNYHVERVRSGKDKPRNFTKLPYLYRDILSEGMVRFPIFTFMDCDDPFDKYSTGFGRALVIGRYFPDCKVDVIRSSEEYGIGTTEVVEKVIDLIRNSAYWKDKDFIEDVIVFLEPCGAYYYIKEICFGHDYMDKRKWWKPNQYIEDTVSDYLWEKQRKIILDDSEDYFDKIVKGMIDSLDRPKSEKDEYFI